MATIQSQLRLNDGMTPVLRKINSTLLLVLDSFDAMQASSSNAIDTANIQQARSMLIGVNSELDEINSGASRLPGHLGSAENAADKLYSKFMSLAAAAGLAFSVKNVLELADTMTQTEARLNLITSDLEKTAALQDQIMASANRSRANYQSTADAVSKLGLMAGQAFKNTDEIVAFTEILNKQFTIAGTSASGIDAAMLQLTQAMGSGVLRGEEYNSVLEQAPNIIQNIAKYIGENEEVLNAVADGMGMKSEELASNVQGNLKDIAAEGLLSADLVKNAMFYAANDVTAQFENMPYTFSQVVTMIQNILLDAFGPVIQAIGSGAQFIHDNWATISPVLLGLATTVGILTAAYLIHTAVTWLSVTANQALVISMLSNPLLWIAILIGVVVAAMYKWIQSIGGVKNAWEICKLALIVSWNAVKLAFFTGIYWVIDLIDTLKLAWQKAGVAIANFMGDMKVNVLTILQNMINGAIDIINDFIGLLNKIPGVNIDAIEHVTFAATASAENEAAKQARADDLATYEADIAAAKQSRADNLASMQTELANSVEDLQLAYSAAKSEAAAASQNDTGFEDLMAGIDTTTSGIGANTDSIKDSSAAAAGAITENLEYLRDIAEQEAINRFTTAEVKIDYSGMTNRIDSNMDLDGVISALTDGFTEGLSMAAEGVHA